MTSAVDVRTSTSSPVNKHCNLDGDFDRHIYPDDDGDNFDDDDIHVK